MGEASGRVGCGSEGKAGRMQDSIRLPSPTILEPPLQRPTWARLDLSRPSEGGDYVSCASRCLDRCGYCRSYLGCVAVDRVFDFSCERRAARATVPRALASPARRWCLASPRASPRLCIDGRRPGVHEGTYSSGGKHSPQRHGASARDFFNRLQELWAPKGCPIRRVGAQGLDSCPRPRLAQPRSNERLLKVLNSAQCPRRPPFRSRPVTQPPALSVSSCLKRTPQH
jgi:hypothetical protein